MISIIMTFYYYCGAKIRKKWRKSIKEDYF